MVDLTLSAASCDCQISLGRVPRLMTAVPLTRVCIQYNGRPRRYSCDHQSWAGPPPRGHGPLDTSYAFNMMVDLAPKVQRRIEYSCNRQSWAKARNYLRQTPPI